MSNHLRSRCASLIAGAATATVLAGVTPPPADARPDQVVGGQHRVAAALDVAGTLVEPARAVTATDRGFVREGGEVSFAADASGSVHLAGSTGAVTVGLPGGASAHGAATADGVLYSGVGADTDLVASASSLGGAQLIAVLGSASAPRSLEFAVDAGADSELAANPDGSISVRRSSTLPGGSVVTEEIGRFAAPWAVDARGVDVATRYVVEAGTLVQVVEPGPGTTYPVTADPTFKFTLLGAYAHWSRSEVKAFAGASISSVTAAVGVACKGTPLSTACIVAAPTISYIERR